MFPLLQAVLEEINTGHHGWSSMTSAYLKKIKLFRTEFEHIDLQRNNLPPNENTDTLGRN